jgi:predicted nucleic acid-binding protein
MSPAATRFAVDTSCMVAAVCGWHVHHAAAAAAIELRLERRERMHAPAPALVEAYAVLTRLPPPHRMSPADAWAVLSANFVDNATVDAIDANSYVTLLRSGVQAGVAGGKTYDVVIGECARMSGASVLLTFNRRHFEPAPHGVAVVVPSVEG